MTANATNMGANEANTKAKEREKKTVEKGFLVRKPIANTFLYSPVISEKRYRGETISSVVKLYYNNSYTSLVSQFVEEEKMNLEELKALIVQIENTKK